MEANLRIKRNVQSIIKSQQLPARKYCFLKDFDNIKSFQKRFIMKSLDPKTLVIDAEHINNLYLFVSVSSFPPSLGSPRQQYVAQIFVVTLSLVDLFFE